MRLLCSCLILAFGCLPMNAQPATTDLQKDLLRELRYAQNRAVALAEEFPAEKYSWRPGEGVRSVSEQLMHLVTNKHYLLGIAGVREPDGMSRELEKTVTSKEEIVPMIKAAYKKAIDAITDSDPSTWDEPVNLFWKPANKRTVYCRLVIHSNEHVGHLVAYARMNGIVPPWSRKR